MFSQESKRACLLLSRVMDYPDADWKALADTCMRERGCENLHCNFPGMAKPLESFAAFVGSQTVGQCEELYSATFDNTPGTTLYVGHHLFGDGAKRSAFMVRLQEAYNEHSFPHGTELPDHLCVVLRFLAVCRDASFAVPLLEEGVLPAVKKIEAALGASRNPYHHALGALNALIKQVLAEASKGRITV